MKNTKTISIDLDCDAEKLLEKYMRGRHTNHSSVFNELIKTMFDLEPQVRGVLSNTIKTEFHNALDSRPNPGTYAEEEQQKLLTRYDNIYRFINGGLSLKTPCHMTKITLKNSYAIIPDDWIRVDWTPENKSSCVGIIETRNGVKFGGIPHFYFTSDKGIYSLSEEDKEAILNLCAKKYPLLQEILDSDKNGITTLAEVDEIPEPIFLSLSLVWDPSMFPCEARIVLKNSTEVRR